MRGLFKKAVETKLLQRICDYDNAVYSQWQSWVHREDGKLDRVRDDRAFMEMSRLRRAMNNRKNDIIAALKPKKDEAFKKHKKITAYEARFTTEIAGIAAYYDALLLAYIEKRPDLKEWLSVEAELDEGDFEAAAQALSSDTPVVRGLSVHEYWRGEVQDMSAIVRQVLEGSLPIAALQPNQAYFDAEAEAHKTNLRIDGVEAKRIPSLRVRAFGKAERAGDLPELEDFDIGALAVGNQKSSKV